MELIDLADKLKIASQILTTEGVNSKVFNRGNRQQYKAIGHVGLFDFDGMRKSEILDRTMELDGINILWASSDTGYHLWNLSIRSVHEIALMGLNLNADPEHVAVGYRKGKWILRISEKKQACGRAYKPAPKFLARWCNESTHFQSKAHWRLFKSLRPVGYRPTYPKAYLMEGCGAEIEQYITMTDALKEQIYG